MHTSVCVLVLVAPKNKWRVGWLLDLRRLLVAKLRPETDGWLDEERDYVVELERQLDDAASLAVGGKFVGPFYTRLQIHGRVQFVAWMNPGRKLQLQRCFGSIKWDAHAQEASRRGLLVLKKRLVKKTDKNLSP